MKKYDVIIIGEGPGGMTSALYASRANLSTLMIDRGLAGGQMNNTAGIENYTGFKNILGAKLGEFMYKSSTNFGAKSTYGNVTNVKLAPNHDKIITTDERKQYEARVLIIASGARQRKLNIPGEKKYAGKGVSYCAVCDGNFFKKQPVTVIGGGDSAFTEAIYLSHIVSSVDILIRKGHPQAEPEVVDKAKKTKNINIHYSTIAKAIVGNGTKVTGLKISVNGKPSQIKTSAVFIYIGILPVTKLFKNLTYRNHSILDKYGWVKSNSKMQTVIPGVFAIGDVRENQLRQVVTAVGDGGIAGHEAYRYISKNF